MSGMTEEELRKANADIAELVRYAQLALNKATEIADRHEIDFKVEMPAGDPLFYRPHRNHWINSTHQCEEERYDGRDYGWSQTDAEPLQRISRDEAFLRFT